MTTTGRFILVLLIIALAVLVVLPFILNTIGVNIFRFGTSGNGFFGNGNESILLSLGENNWTNASFLHDKNTNSPTQFFDFSFHSSDLGIIFLGTKGNGLWKSVDAGKTWGKMSDSKHILIPDSDVYKIAIAKSRPTTMYAAVYHNNRGRVLKSEDGGETFREIYFVSQDRFGVFDCYVDPMDSEHVLVATGQGGLLETRDGGASWHVKYWFFEGIMRLLVNPSTMTEMYAISEHGSIWKTVDGGQNWTDALIGFSKQTKTQVNSSPIPQGYPFRQLGTFSEPQVSQFLPDPNSFSTLYIVKGGNLWRSKNGGASWEKINVIISPSAAAIRVVALYPGHPYTIFAAVQNQLYRSDDNGLTWRISTLPTMLSIKHLLIPSGNSDLMLAIVGR